MPRDEDDRELRIRPKGEMSLSRVASLTSFAPQAGPTPISIAASRSDDTRGINQSLRVPRMVWTHLRTPIRHRPKFTGLRHCSGGGLWRRLPNCIRARRPSWTAPCWRPYAESVTNLDCRGRSFLSRVHEEADEVIGLWRRGLSDGCRFPRLPSPCRNSLSDRRRPYARDDGPRASQTPHRGGIRDSDNPRDGLPRRRRQGLRSAGWRCLLSS